MSEKVNVEFGFSNGKKALVSVEKDIVDDAILAMLDMCPPGMITEVNIDV